MKVRTDPTTTTAPGTQTVADDQTELKGPQSLAQNSGGEQLEAIQSTPAGKRYTGGVDPTAGKHGQSLEPAGDLDTVSSETHPPADESGGTARLQLGGAIDHTAILTTADHATWRNTMHARLARSLGSMDIGTVKVFHAADPKPVGPASKTKLVVRADSTPEQLRRLDLHLEGWGLALGILNDLMTGVGAGESLLEIHRVGPGDRPEDSMASTSPPETADGPPSLDRLQIREDSHWRYLVTERVARCVEPERFGVKKAYLFGSVARGRCGPGSDIDLIFHVDDDPTRQEDLKTWLSGFSVCFGAFNELLVNTRLAQRGESRDDYAPALSAGCRDGILDVFCLTDQLIESDSSWAAHINSIHNPATPLRLSA